MGPRTICQCSVQPASSVSSSTSVSTSSTGAVVAWIA
jgi:hypothetical protein